MKLKFLTVIIVFSMIFASTFIVKPVKAYEGLDFQEDPGATIQDPSLQPLCLSQQPVIQPEPVPIDEPIPETPQPEVPQQPEQVEEVEEKRKTISEIWKEASTETQEASTLMTTFIVLRASYFSLILFLKHLPDLIGQGIRTIPLVVLLVIRLISIIPKFPQYIKEIVLFVQQLLPLIHDLFSLM
jgi:hypothetical protein